jgi:Domain of unknown function (DUF6894)
MPMFYFDLRPHDAANKTIADPDGTDLPDQDAARKHANTVARELIYRSERLCSSDWSTWTMSVQDDKGTELFSFAMTDR